MHGDAIEKVEACPECGERVVLQHGKRSLSDSFATWRCSHCQFELPMYDSDAKEIRQCLNCGRTGTLHRQKASFFRHLFGG